MDNKINGNMKDNHNHETIIEELKKRNALLRTKKMFPKKVEPEKRKSAMQIICDWTQLVTQQNYLESTQLKLKPEDFCDFEDLGTSEKQTAEDLEGWMSTGHALIASQIIDINNLKERLREDLKIYSDKSKDKIEDFRLMVNNLKEDVFQTERLRNISLPSTRSRIISINSKLEQMKSDTNEELNRLKQDELKLEAEIEDELKPITDFDF